MNFNLIPSNTLFKLSYIGLLHEFELFGQAKLGLNWIERLFIHKSYENAPDYICTIKLDQDIVGVFTVYFKGSVFIIDNILLNTKTEKDFTEKLEKVHSHLVKVFTPYLLRYHFDELHFYYIINIGNFDFIFEQSKLSNISYNQVFQEEKNLHQKENCITLKSIIKENTNTVRPPINEGECTRMENQYSTEYYDSDSDGDSDSNRDSDSEKQQETLLEKKRNNRRKRKRSQPYHRFAVKYHLEYYPLNSIAKKIGRPPNIMISQQFAIDNGYLIAKSKLENKDSEDMGWGLYTMNTIKKDSKIGEFKGEILNDEEFKSKKRRDKTLWCLKLSGNNERTFKLLLPNRESYVNYVNSPKNCDANGSECLPNARLGNPARNGISIMSVFATRTIKEGEEITMNYGHSYFK